MKNQSSRVAIEQPKRKGNYFFFSKKKGNRELNEKRKNER